jgi:hypothetical protein
MMEGNLDNKKRASKAALCSAALLSSMVDIQIYYVCMYMYIYQCLHIYVC